MTRPPLPERQRQREAKRQSRAKWQAKQQEGRKVKCAICGRVIMQDVLSWGNGGDFGVGKACSQTCFEKLKARQ